MTHTVHCKKLNKAAPGLTNPPYPGELGQRIYREISAEAWQSWLDLQVMLVNEHRLNLSEKESRQFLRTEMEKFLFENVNNKPAGFVAPE